MIPQNIIDQIRENADIVEIAMGYINLKKIGKSYKALCPFHVEKTPSFIVSPEKQIFHCFGCGVGGNVFNLVMKMENVNFIESIRLLAKRMGISVADSSEESLESKEKEEIYKLNEEAALLYYSCLSREFAKEVQKYLYSRKLNDDTIKKFKIGFAPGGRFLVQEFIKRKFRIDLLKKSGLVAFREEDGEPQDYFRNRITFPIFNLQNRVIGFGARVLDDAQPKYLNTPDAPVFSKGRTLYGLNFTKEGVRKKNEVIIVEGYLDFLTLYQNGVDNVVASLGTALTEGQISILRRYTDKVVMCYDADTAGQEATLRSLDLLIEKELEPRIVVLPSGDPDSFVKENGVKAFLEKVQSSLHLIDYHFYQLFSKYNPDSTDGKVGIASELFPILARVKNIVQRGIYLKRLAQELQMDERVIYAEFERVNKKKKWGLEEGLKDIGGREKKQYLNQAEAILIKLIFEDNNLISKVKKELEIEDIRSPGYQKILKGIFDLLEKYDIINIKALIDYVQDENLSSIVSRLSLEPDLEFEDREKAMKDCILRIKKLSIMERKREIESEIRKLEKEGRVEQLNLLLNKYQELERILRGY